MSSSELRTYIVGEGLTKTMVWETEDGWRQDGPACNGPEEVRTSGRGPWWKGPVEESHVEEFIKLAKAAGIPVKESSSNAQQ